MLCVLRYFLYLDKVLLCESHCKLITRIAQALSVHVSLFTSIRLPELFFLIKICPASVIVIVDIRFNFLSNHLTKFNHSWLKALVAFKFV